MIALLGEPGSRAEALAKEIAIPFTRERQPAYSGYLYFAESRLALSIDAHPEYKEFFLDFASPQELARLKQSVAQDPLRKSIGKRVRGQTIWDFTLGLGKDALEFSRLGLEVFAWERSKITHALWRDAMERGKQIPELADLLLRIHGFLGDAREALHAQRDGKVKKPDFIYIDPMYPEAEKGSAKRRKEMVLLRAIAGDDPDAAGLFSIACEANPKRIIVKRPLHAQVLSGRPALDFRGKSHRFDVYIRGISF